MKKLFYGMAALALLLPSCESDQNSAEIQEAQIDMSDFYVYTDADIDEPAKANDNSRLANFRTCYTMANLNRLLNENPGLEKKMFDIEYQTRKFISKGNGNKPGGGGSGGGTGGTTDVDVALIPDNLTINIPVYVHIVLPNANDVSNSQVQSQINVLNSDFNSRNINQLPSNTTFENDATLTGINFTLAGTFRYNNSTSSWGTNDAVKRTYPPITPETHLNIWVCNIGGGILGYAQFPGGSPSTDGVVLLYSSLPGGSAAPYNLGRTATHEVGHYLNLRHIWGDGRCRQDDFIVDTPSSDRANYGCPSYPLIHCNDPDMTMNYMDYTDDACMYMFTDGQTNRMRAIFQPGGPRAAMAN